MKWWGTAWPAPDWPADCCAPDDRVPVPVGQMCLACNESIEINDSGVSMPCGEMDPDDGWLMTIRAQHAECFIRSVVGPLAHLEKRCYCFGGTGHDTPGLTARQEARLVFAQICEEALAQRDQR